MTTPTDTVMQAILKEKATLGLVVAVLLDDFGLDLLDVTALLTPDRCQWLGHAIEAGKTVKEVADELEIDYRESVWVQFMDEDEDEDLAGDPFDMRGTDR